jgi:response regulator RpfG family c-di-GMP phosphodiesterase
MMGTKKNILAIDDNIATLNQVRAVLEETYEVSLAKNTDIARKILNSVKVHLILLDMNMPGESGMEFLEMIRNDPLSYYIPVIIVSSQGTADAIINTKEGGASDFVVKPVSSQILLEKIEAALAASRGKTSRDFLIKKLRNLENSCATGKSSQAEKAVKDLESVYYNIETDMLIAEICKFARNMEYSLAVEKIKPILSELSGDDFSIKK